MSNEPRPGVIGTGTFTPPPGVTQEEIERRVREADERQRQKEQQQ